MKKNLVPIVATVLILSLPSIAYADVYSSIAEPTASGGIVSTLKLKNPPLAPNTILPDGSQIQVGTPGTQNIQWNDPNYTGTQPMNMAFNAGYMSIGGDTTKFAPVNHYDDISKSSNNGYWIAEEDRISDWTAALNGDPTFVNQMFQKYKGTMSLSGDTWNVMNFAALVDACGASFGSTPSQEYLVQSDGKLVGLYDNLIPTPAPNSSLKTDKTTYNQGDTINITATANIYADPSSFLGTNNHFEAFELVGPNGYDKFLPINSVSLNGTNEGSVGPATGTSFDQAANVYGGGSGSATTPKTYTDSIQLNTLGLTPGTYYLKYTLYDGVGRASTSGGSGSVTSGTIAASFSVTDQPAKQGPTQTGVTGSPLTMKFGNIPSTLKGGTTSVPVIISNSGDKSVTTTLNFTLSGTMPQAYQQAVTTTSTDPSTGKTITTTTYVTKFANHPFTQTISKTITVPAFQTTTWVISSGLLDTISGGNPSTYANDNLDVYGPADSNGVYLSDAYSPTIQVTASDASDYVSPTISAYIPTDGSISNPNPGHLTR